MLKARFEIKPDPTGAQCQEGASSDGKTSSRIVPRRQVEGVMYEGCLRSESDGTKESPVPWVLLLEGGQSFYGQEPFTFGLKVMKSGLLQRGTE